MARKKEWFFSGDVDFLSYGGMWLRHIDGPRWHAVRITNMDDAIGRDNAGSPRYHGELVEVDLTSGDMAGALQFNGWEDEEDLSERWRADALVSYGAYAPLESDSSNNGTALVTAMKAASRRLQADADAYEAAMSRPVNGIGQTAREYAQGMDGLASALARGVAAGDPNALLMGGLYQRSDGATLGGERFPVERLGL